MAALSVKPVKASLRSPRSSHAVAARHHLRCASTNTAVEGRQEQPVNKSQHHDLASFLAHASRKRLDAHSTTYVGTHYEYVVQSALARLGFALQRTGGASDRGIDLVGAWRVPSSPEPLRVLLQCKAHAQKLGPAVARELEGALAGAPDGWRTGGVMALLVAQRSSTRGVREALGRSNVPMGFVLCSEMGHVMQMLWNRRAEEEGLLGMGVGLRYRADDPAEKEVVLNWKGEKFDSSNFEIE